MPLLAQDDSDDEMDVRMSHVRKAVKPTTPLSGQQRTFTSKADLLNGNMDDEIPDHDFMDDSDDSDLEIYGQVKGSEKAAPVYSITNLDEVWSQRNGSQMDHHTDADVHKGLGAHSNRDRVVSIDMHEDEQVSEVDHDSGELESPLEIHDRDGSCLRGTGWKPNTLIPRFNEEQGDVSEEDSSASSNSDADLYIKAEQGGFSESESIHHDGESDGAGSTIHVTPSLEQPSNGQRPSPISDAQHLIPELIDAPQEVQTLLNEYWDVHGRKVPPCGAFTHPKKLYHNATGQPATWLHISGEVLQTSLYRLSGIPTDYKTLEKRVLVVKGETLGPFIVSFYCGGGGSRETGVRGLGNTGSRYRIWQGLGGETADGFEAKTSVWKGYPSRKGLEDLKAAEIHFLFEGPAPRIHHESQTKPTDSQTTSNSSELGRLSSSIPKNLRLLLEAWFVKYGRRAPLCAGQVTEGNFYKRSSGGSAVWWHKSGVRLKPSLCPVEEDKPNLPHPRLTIVQGEGVSPLAVGLEGDDRGFEEGCSVFKSFTGRTPTHDDLMRWEGSASKITTSAPKPTKPPPSVRISASTYEQSLVEELNKDIPVELRTILEDWFARKGRSVPPCGGYVDVRTLRSKYQDKLAGWWHKCGKRLTADIYPFELGKPSNTRTKRLLIVRGDNVGPFMVRHMCSAESQVTGWRIWNGASCPDPLGSESGCSIFKANPSLRPTITDLQGWEQKVMEKVNQGSHGPASYLPRDPYTKKTNSKAALRPQNGTLARDRGENLRPRESISAPEKFTSSNAGSRYAGSYRQVIGKRRRNDGEKEEDAESLLSSFLSPATERTPAALQAKPSALAEHVKNNVVLLFYPRVDDPPRVRLLGSCGNVQKLFAQALAGDVFGDGGGSGRRVLALTFGGGKQKSRSLVEDDDQDYDDLVTAVKALDCWFMKDGVLHGSLTVEVRAK